MHQLPYPIESRSSDHRSHQHIGLGVKRQRREKGPL
jgi:hypothetical protein